MAEACPAATVPTQAEVHFDRLLALPLTGTEQVDASEEQQDLASFYSRSRKGKQRATERDAITDDTASDAVVAAQLTAAAERDERETRAIALFCELWEGRCADGTAASAGTAEGTVTAATDPAVQPAQTGMLIDFDDASGEKDAERPAPARTSAAREPEAPESPALSLSHARASADSEDQAARSEGCNGEVEEGRETRPSLPSVRLSSTREANYQAGSGRLSTPASNDTEQVGQQGPAPSCRPFVQSC